ncbi:uncharacterized protein FHS18_005654 [Paenibacillus phyllosphaerae]|uniref:HD/PDEase domain-containing protein n=1 Tax=Paenibacillus phyllosphaerae TaxID=274593 RepID=A0A7W5B331_9BACL|nr:DUF3658 domain-containing protein [Paenibacillus phyllosphaerae]MBB3113542.1 uncharacterized protein [Paenibacillus phyllosphaerae]
MVLKAEEQIQLTRAFVRKAMEADSSGHDWWHIERVTRSAKLLAELEGADPFTCEMAALLHDIADEKLNPSKEEGLKRVVDWLSEIGVSSEASEHILLIISTMSYSGGGGAPMETLEGCVVQDADRLDAIGAIASARTFAYSGWKGQAMYDPDIRPRASFTKEQYRNEKSTAINHFFEKLLKLKSLMNTDAAKSLSEQRHAWMERFVSDFDAEWELGNPNYLEESAYKERMGNRIHIVFNDSAAHSLRQVIKDERVVSLCDNQTIGPLQSTHNPASLKIREYWMDAHLLGGRHDHMRERLLLDAIAWRSWPQRLGGSEVVVWAGDSVFEQINLRRLMEEIPDSAAVSVVRTTKLYEQRTMGAIRYAHTGEMSPDHLRELRAEAKPLTQAMRNRYAKEWKQLVTADGMLRIWTGEELRTVPVDHWDEAILETIEQVRRPGAKFVPVSQVAGRMFSHQEQRIDERFIYYRIQALIDQGKLVVEEEKASILEQQVRLAVEMANTKEQAIADVKQWAAESLPALERLLNQLEDLEARETSAIGQLNPLLAEFQHHIGESGNGLFNTLVDEYIEGQQAQFERRKRLAAIVSSFVQTGEDQSTRE